MSPLRVAASIAMGLAVGCLPIFGLHLAIVLVLSLRFRLDGALAYVAANISNPFFAPFLFTGEVQIGALVLDHHVLSVESGLTLARALRSFPAYLAVGSPIVSLGLAVVIGALSFALITAKRGILGPGKKRAPYALPASAPPWIVAVEHVASRYASASGRTAAERTHFHYVRIKLVMDPVAKLIAGIAGDGPFALGDVVDVGTGRGQLPILLAELGRAKSAVGVDWDEEKIEAGKLAAETQPALDVAFRCGDARTAEVPPADSVLVIDLLHYFTLPEQEAILRNAARSVRPGGRIVVREADTERGIRSFVTLLEERFFTLLKFNRGERVKFRPAREIAEILKSEGLAPRIEPAWGSTPFSNVLIVGERKLASTTGSSTGAA